MGVTPHPKRDASAPKPFSHDSKIFIIGAGPGGIHMGHLLKKHGFTKVTILEKNAEIGGKSKSLVYAPAGEDIPHEMGTCFMHPGYHKCMKLADEYGAGPYFKTGGDTYDKCNIFSPKLNKEKGFPEDQPQFLLDWMFSDVELETVNKCCFCLPDQIQILTVFDAITRYSALHKEIFGVYDYTLPPRPDAETMKKIDMPFMEFIKLHRLQALIPIFLLGNSAQGYGLLETIPTFYGLWWNIPELLNSLIEKKPLTQMFQKGFQNLWKQIAEKDELNVIFNAEVISVDRNLGARDKPIVIEAQVNKESQTYECDFLIVTAPLKHFMSNLKDAVKEETDLFSVLQPATLLTSLIKTNVPNPEERSTTYYPERLTPSQQGKFYAERNSSRAIWPNREQPKDVRYAVAYQYFEDFKEGREAECTESMIKDLKEAGYSDIEVITLINWEYFPKFTREYINKGYPWKILDLQGAHRTWYAGSSACFESAEDVVCYNHLLFRTFNME